MFEEISKYIDNEFNPNDEIKNDLQKFFTSMESTTPKVEEAMMKMKKKFTFESIESLKTPTPYDTTNTLYFWREHFDFPMTPALHEEEVDFEFMHFVDEDDIYNPFRNTDGEYDRICFDIYHSWLGFIFQKTKMYESGIPVGITMNGSGDSYYFNDFSNYNFSNYHELYDTNNRTSIPFNRDLTIEEIFIRTHFIKVPYNKIELFSINDEVIEIAELENAILKISKLSSETESLIASDEKSLTKCSKYKRDLNSDIDEIIKYFESSINNGSHFSLLKSVLAD